MNITNFASLLNSLGPLLNIVCVAVGEGMPYAPLNIGELHSMKLHAEWIYNGFFRKKVEQTVFYLLFNAHSYGYPTNRVKG